MNQYLTDRSAAFDPETVRTLSDALDDAWRCIDTGKAHCNDQNGTAREALAEFVINLADRGERNRQRLVEGALVRFKL